MLRGTASGADSSSENWKSQWRLANKLTQIAERHPTMIEFIELNKFVDDRITLNTAIEASYQVALAKGVNRRRRMIPPEHEISGAMPIGVGPPRRITDTVAPAASWPLRGPFFFPTRQKPG
jgi:hypothetical protein